MGRARFEAGDASRHVEVWSPSVRGIADRPAMRSSIRIPRGAMDPAHGAIEGRGARRAIEVALQGLERARQTIEIAHLDAAQTDGTRNHVARLTAVT